MGEITNEQPMTAFDATSSVPKDMGTGPQHGAALVSAGFWEDRDVLSWNIVELSAKKRPNILSNIGEWDVLVIWIGGDTDPDSNLRIIAQGMMKLGDQVVPFLKRALSVLICFSSCLMLTAGEACTGEVHVILGPSGASSSWPYLSPVACTSG